MLVAYTVSIELNHALRFVVEQLRRHSAEAANQVERAAISVAHNIAEGSRRSGRDQRRFYIFAQGSASEIRAALDIADAWGWDVDCTDARRLVDRQLALLWGLCHGRRESRETRETQRRLRSDVSQAQGSRASAALSTSAGAQRPPAQRPHDTIAG